MYKFYTTWTNMQIKSYIYNCHGYKAKNCEKGDLF